MATLVGQDLFEYLSHLGKEIQNLQKSYDSGDFTYEMHDRMRRIIDSETIFLQKVHQNQPTLAFSGNGLPTIESLKPDLEAISSLSSENSNFKDISETYCPIKQESEDHAKDAPYSEMSKKDFEDLLENQPKKIIIRNSFDIGETLDGRLELKCSKRFYVDSIDEISQQHPIARINGRTRYQMAWGRLFSESNQTLLGVQRDLVLQKSLPGNTHTLLPANLILNSQDISIPFDLDSTVANFKKYPSDAQAYIFSVRAGKIIAEKNPKVRFKLAKENCMFRLYELTERQITKKVLWRTKQYSLDVQSRLAEIFSNSNNKECYARLDPTNFRDQLDATITDLSKILDLRINVNYLLTE